MSLGYDNEQRISSIDAYQGSGDGTQVYHAAFTLDADSNLTDLTYTPGSGGASMPAYHWDYTENGLVNDEYSLSDTTSGATSSYTTWAKTSDGYDHDSELTSTSYSTNFASAPTSNTAESFDGNGNRTGESSAVGAGNRMLFDGTYYYAYDADGNRIAKYLSTTGAFDSTATDITTYAWNEKNEMTAVKTFATYADYAAGGDVTEIDYRDDAFGNMVSRTQTEISGGSGGSSEPAEFFFYDGSNLALILNTSGGVIERELDGPAVDQVFASEAGSASTTLTAGTADWYLADNQGTVRDVVQLGEGGASVVNHIDYDSSGQVTSQSDLPFAPTFTYAGTFLDPDTGLNLMGLRWYDPVVGVFVSQDPIGFGGGQTNTEAYVGNSPTNFTDPSGMIAKTYADMTPEEYARCEAHYDQAYLATFHLRNVLGYEDKLEIPGTPPGRIPGSRPVGTITDSGGLGGRPVRGNPSYTQGFTDEAVNIAKTAVIGAVVLAALPEAAATTALFVGVFFGGYQIGNKLYQIMTRNQVDGWGNATGHTLSDNEASSLAGSATADAIALGFSIFSAGGEGGGGGKPGPGEPALGEPGPAEPVPVEPGPSEPGGGGTGSGEPGAGEPGPSNNSSCPSCFLAGTPILVPDDSVDPPLIVSASTPDSASENWLFAAGIVMVGIAGYRDEEKRSKRARKQKRQALDLALGQVKNDDADNFDYAGADDGPKEFATWRSRVDQVILATDALPLAVNVPQQPMLPEMPTSVSSAAGVPCPSSAISAGLAPSHAAKAALPEVASPPGQIDGRMARLSDRPQRSSVAAPSCPRKDNPASPRLIARRGRMWLAACLLIAALFAGKAAWPPSAPPVSAPNVSTVSSTAIREPASRPIETIRVGQRVLTYSAEGASNETHVDPRTWRLLRLRAKNRLPDGTDDPVDMETLQPSEWIAKKHASVGAEVPLPIGLVEIGLPADMRGKVIADEPCPPIRSSSGRVVLATANHLNPHVIEITIADQYGRKERVRPTALHPFYSADRRQWVGAKTLRPGEHLKGIYGPLTVVRSEVVPGTHRVYNMTVEGDHVYRVSLLGALVHNTSQCFPPGTLVLMADGKTKRIESVQHGDLVLSVDPGSGQKPAPHRVLATIKNRTRRLVHIQLDGVGGSAAERDLVATGLHPIWTQSRGWQSAEDINAGDNLQDDYSHAVPVVRSWQERKVSDTYNLSVEGVHTYYVVNGGRSALVHNGGITPYNDPQRPGYNNGATQTDHAIPRSLEGPETGWNEQPLAAETNFRKGGFEGALKAYYRSLIEGGLSPDDAFEVIEPQLGQIVDRPTDPSILDQLPENPLDQVCP